MTNLGVPADEERRPAAAVKQVAFVYNDRLPTTLPLARTLAEKATAIGREARLVSVWDEQLRSMLTGVDLAVTFGGDGTILRTAREAAPQGVPILGVNQGRVGFLAELQADEAASRLSAFLDGHCRVEERDMLAVGLGESPSINTLADHYYALNDVLIGRGERARVVMLNVAVDGAPVASIRADGLVVASTTGSTGYSLSAGGPIVHPGVRAMVLTPIVPHLTAFAPFVVPIEAVVTVQVFTDHAAMCSVDGQIDVRLGDRAIAHVHRAPFPCRFLRARPPKEFYETLLQRLGRC